MFFGRFGTFPRPFDLSTEGVALSHQGACIREVRNFCHWASCRDPNLLNWDLGRTSPWTPMESTDPLNSGGCDSSRLGSPNGRSCKLPDRSIDYSSAGREGAEQTCSTQSTRLAHLLRLTAETGRALDAELVRHWLCPMAWSGHASELGYGRFD